MEKKPVMEVKMLGGFSISLEGKALSLDLGGATKMLQLLALLLSSKDGVRQGELLNDLYEEEELADSKNNLRVTVSRLRKTLVAAGLPEDNYITVSGGVYRWGGALDVRSDAAAFEEKIRLADGETGEKSLKLRKEACALYRGEYLPKMSSADWAVVESLRLKNLYTENLQKTCEELKRRREYEEMLRLCGEASAIYPFDEWQAYEIDAEMALGRPGDAMKTYEKAANLFFDELGIPPSENMLRRFRAMSDGIHGETIPDIVADLREDEAKPGAYYCSFPSFIDNFRMLRRMIERTGNSSYLMICALTDKDGQLLEDPAELKMMGEQMKFALEHSLRRGDVYTRYSAAYFLVLLVGINLENTSLVSARIDKYIHSVCGIRKDKVRYHAVSVVEIPQTLEPDWFEESDRKNAGTVKK